MPSPLDPAFWRASPRRLALLGFLGHAPGLRLLGRVRFRPRFVRTNLVAVGLTLAAMVVAGIAAPAGAGGRFVLLTWLVLHFAWSAIVSAWILGGAPLRDDGDRR
ncbi:MAG: hypothetical protein KC486_13940 [Myxococcales bacterium]|nr:hypothetical protein [Myxococcales bacterium]